MKKTAPFILLALILLLPAGCNKSSGENQTDNTAQKKPEDYEQMKPWYNFADAVKKEDYVSACNYICDNWENTTLVTLKKHLENDLKYNTDTKAVQGNVPIKFGEVLRDDPEHFIIEGSIEYGDLDQYKKWAKEYLFNNNEERYQRVLPAEWQSRYERAKKPIRFGFRKIDGKWYYMPHRWGHPLLKGETGEEHLKNRKAGKGKSADKKVEMKKAVKMEKPVEKRAD